VYQGVELEGTARLTEGLLVYANATVNNTHHKFSHTRLAASPGRTAAIRPLIDRKLDFRLNVNNMADDHSRIFLNGTAGDGKTGQFFTNAGRSAFFSVAASL